MARKEEFAIVESEELNSALMSEKSLERVLSEFDDSDVEYMGGHRRDTLRGEK